MTRTSNRNRTRRILRNRDRAGAAGGTSPKPTSVRNALYHAITVPLPPEWTGSRTERLAALIELNKAAVGRVIVDRGLAGTRATDDAVRAAEQLQGSIRDSRARKDLVNVGKQYGIKLHVLLDAHRLLTKQDSEEGNDNSKEEDCEGGEGAQSE